MLSTSWTVALIGSLDQANCKETRDDQQATFKHHRFPAVVILCAVRMYLRYPLSFQYTADLLAERSAAVDRSTVYRWVRKFGPQIADGIERRRQWVGLNWHVDETYIRVGGKWRYLWRQVIGTGI